MCSGVTVWLEFAKPSADSAVMMGALASSFCPLMVTKRTRCEVSFRTSIVFSVHSSRGSLLFAVRMAILPGFCVEFWLNS
jgi:hypothetical protein